MPRVLLIGAAILAIVASVHAAQDAKKTDDGKAVITVTGCIDGSWLHVQKTDYIRSYATRYKLRGSKHVLKELVANHNQHLVEVTGKVTDTATTTHRGKTIQVGKKTRIHTGAKEVPERPSGADDPSLEVASYRDLSDRCR
jgi:hypothetical protein